MFIRMTAQEKELAGEIGRLRYEENLNRRDIAAYNQSLFNLTSLQANRLGALAEIATLKLFGAPYDDESVYLGYVPEERYSELAGRPDIVWAGMNIEVRRANRADSPIPVRTKDKGYMIVQPYIRYEQPGGKMTGIITDLNVEFLGWCNWNDELVQARNWNGNVALNKRPMSSISTLTRM